MEMTKYANTCIYSTPCSHERSLVPIEFFGTEFARTEPERRCAQHTASLEDR